MPNFFVGTIVEACSTEVKSFAGGAILYQVGSYSALCGWLWLTTNQIGYTAVQLLVEVLIGDTTTLRNRVLFSFIPAWPFLVCLYYLRFSCFHFTLYLDKRMGQWKRHGFCPRCHYMEMGYWDVGYHILWQVLILYALSFRTYRNLVCSLPLLLTLYLGSRKAKRSGGLEAYKTPFEQFGWKQLTVALFWQLDVIGIILVIAGEFSAVKFVVGFGTYMSRYSFRSYTCSIHSRRWSEWPVEERRHHCHDW